MGKRTSLIYKTINMVIYILKMLYKALVDVISSFFSELKNRLRFSIKLKITLSYLRTFFWVSALNSTVVIIGFVVVVPQNILAVHFPTIALVLGISMTLGFFLTLIMGNRSGDKIIEPIKQMTKTVKNITINDLSKRIDVSGSKDELKDLAITFNNMMNRIESSVEKQNQFVSDASHELRTPISVVKGYADLLERWGKDEKQVLEESVKAIQNEANHMNKLVEKLLFLARSDMNAQKLEKEQFNLNELIVEIYKETKMIDNEHTIILESLPEDILLFGDKRLIKEAIRAFVENSIKYTDYGGSIKIVLESSEENAKIGVIDTGSGIKEEDISKIFDRFYRADKSRTKKSGGTGLGLSIAKWIIDSHEGTISVKSVEGEGTEIWTFIPKVI